MYLNLHFCELFCGLVSDNVYNGDVFLLVNKHCGICRRSLYPSYLAWEENAQCFWAEIMKNMTVLV